MSGWNCVGWITLVACVTATASATFEYVSDRGHASEFGQCIKGGYCLKFRHESELVLPGTLPERCGHYKMPALEEPPKPSDIAVPPGTSDKEVVKLLLGYIDQVLTHDQVSKQLLLKHYQGYLDACIAAAANLSPTD